MRTQYSVMHNGMIVALVDSLQEAAVEIHKRAKLTLESVLNELKKMKKLDDKIPLARGYALGRTSLPVLSKSKRNVNVFRINIENTKYDNPMYIGKIIYFPKGLRGRLVLDAHSTALLITKQSVNIIIREFPNIEWSDIETHKENSYVVDGLLTRASYLFDLLSRNHFMENPMKDNPLITWNINTAIQYALENTPNP